MIKKIIFAMVCLLTIPVLAHAQATVSGNLKNAGVVNITGSNTFVRFTLEGYGANIPRVSGTNVIVPGYQDYHPDSNGNISGSIQGNDTISVGSNSPGGTWYQVCIYYQGQIYQCNNFTITGSSFNLNSASPNTTNPTVTPGGPANEVVATPDGVAGATSLRALKPGDIPSTINSNTSGNAATASALAATPTGCTLPNVSMGIQANGNSNCNEPTNSTGTAANATTWNGLSVAAPTAAEQCNVSSSTSATFYGSCAGTAGEQVLVGNLTKSSGGSSTTNVVTLQTVTLSAGVLNTVGRIWNITIRGESQVGTAGTLNPGLVISDTHSHTLNLQTNATNLPSTSDFYSWKLSGECWYQSATSFYCSFDYLLTDATSGTSMWIQAGYPFGGAFTAMDLADAITISSTAQFGTSNASNTASTALLTVEQLQ